MLTGLATALVLTVFPAVVVFTALWPASPFGAAWRRP